MGEARRRTLATRDGGDIVEFLTDLSQRSAASLAGQRPDDADVACAGCVACCYHRVDVHPSVDDVQHLDCETRGDGLFLRKRADGGCIHLGETGCTVYERRPMSCRQFDCRVGASVGMQDVFDRGHRSPRWVFRAETPAAVALRDSMLKLAAEHRGLRTVDAVFAAVAERLAGAAP